MALTRGRWASLFALYVASGVVIVGGVGAVLAAQGTTAKAGPRFEIVSVKANASGDSAFSYSPAPGLLRIHNMPLRVIIAEAYEVGGSYRLPDFGTFRIAGGPASVLSNRFDVTARMAPDASNSQIAAMLRRLLAERFALQIHSETRSMPIYALAVSPNGIGPQLRPSPVDCMQAVKMGVNALNATGETRSVCWPSPRPNQFRASVRQTYAGPIRELIRRIEPFLDRPLVDETGLSGYFQWDTSFGQTPDTDAPTIFDAFETDLGLRLDPRTGPYEIFVIDSVQRPTPD